MMSLSLTLATLYLLTGGGGGGGGGGRDIHLYNVCPSSALLAPEANSGGERGEASCIYLIYHFARGV
ncbi:hypothetical protein THAOC_00433 [Thalassiosira oceanica]|uniref:Secreted protein n=1 Tax=Thalassiosira oceanica TaxID=159749 RepID=K0TG97_THAOC|nr:hypothetical protein THAOC_00433 [Thalassiosira oceanica]|eukprot:EJK77718.1 hypothetical protein THAOC_00433 [Thalassiosira oceanica]